MNVAIVLALAFLLFISIGFPEVKFDSDTLLVSGVFENYPHNYTWEGNFISN